MPEFIQPAFDFIEPLDPRRPKCPERVFTCIGAGKATSTVARCRAWIKRDNAILVKGIFPDRFHISLRGIGDYVRIPTRVPFAAIRAAQRIVLSPFEVVLYRAVTFPGFRDDRPTVLLAESRELRELADMLFGHLRREGLRPGEFRDPHMTLFYSPRSIRPVDIEPIRFRVDRFYLIHSECGLTRYNVLGCWLLNGSGAATPGPLAFGSMAA
ncbi:MAG: 2'-5' RNA ligase family protein [Mesorhizobium sp.]